MIGEPRVNVLALNLALDAAKSEMGSRPLDGRTELYWQGHGQISGATLTTTSPGSLLEAARRETDRRGGSKIFIGAAPGVGKT